MTLVDNLRFRLGQELGFRMGLSAVVPSLHMNT